MIAASLPPIEDCWDCADFCLVPLLWCRARYAARPHARRSSRAIDAAILGYRYWMDEPGNDVQWYFSENHALLFHTARLPGRAPPARRHASSAPAAPAPSSRRSGRDRVRAWLDHFEHWEMAEFNSAPYFPIDLKGLTALFALAPDADIRDRAAPRHRPAARDRRQLRPPRHPDRRAGPLLRAHAARRPLAGAVRHRPAALGHGQLRRALPRPAAARPLPARPRPRPCPTSPPAPPGTGDGEQEWCFAQGEDGFAALYHYKTRAWAHGHRPRAYRWGDWGYQETLLHARIGTEPEAQIWINHPGEADPVRLWPPLLLGRLRPRCRASSSTAAWRSSRSTAPPTQPDFTHAWFPPPAFDESARRGPRRLRPLGRRPRRCSSPTARSTWSTERPDRRTASCACAGRPGRWILRLGERGASSPPLPPASPRLRADARPRRPHRR